MITPEWVHEVMEVFNTTSKLGVAALKPVLPKEVAIAILERTERLLAKESSLVEVRGAA